MAAPAGDASATESVEFPSEFCVMHVVPTAKSNLITFHKDNWRRFVDFASMWLKFEGKESEIVTETATKLGINFHDLDSCIAAQPTSANIGYHYPCYRRFCDISKIRRKERKTSAAGTDINQPDDERVSLQDAEPPQKRRLRSGEQREWRKRHMFPEECIFCHGHRYKRNKITGKRALQRLVKCELIRGGQLLEAAQRKGDSDMLQQIEGEDLVARELQYHHECYRDYTRFLSKPSKPLTEIQSGYMKAFNQFCEGVISKRLLQGKEILTLTTLNRIFIRTIKEVENIDAPYRTWNLKKRLQKTFPQLIFVTPPKRNMSDIVFSEHLCAEEIAPDLAIDDSSSDVSSTDDDEEVREQQAEPKSPHRETQHTSDFLHVLYNAALMLKSEMDKPSSSVPWPPSSDDLTLEKSKALIPHHLFNFLAWIVGASDDANQEDYVKTSESKERRLLSIGQDILFMKNSKKPMPKHFI